MVYIPTVWQDEVLAADERFDIKEDGGGAFKATMQIALATSVSVAGTPVTAANMNHIEAGIEDVEDQAEAVAVTAAAAIPKSIVTAIGQLIYSTASGVVAALTKPSVDSVLKNTSAGTPSWKALTDFLFCTNRQGGNATDWSDGGTPSNYVVSSQPKMQAGATLLGSGVTSVTITFPVAFSNKPLIFPGSELGTKNVGFSAVSATQVTINGDDATGSYNVDWLAIGPA
jgi:hypothetical protein